MVASLDKAVIAPPLAEGGTSVSERVLRECVDAERSSWDEFVKSAPNGHVMQGWSWGECKQQEGWIPVRLAVVQDERIIAAAQLLIRKAFGIALAYVPHGPACDPADTTSYQMLLDAFHQHARRHRAVFLRLAPNEVPESNLERALLQRGFIHARKTMPPIDPWATFVVDLTGEPNDVQLRMTKSTRQYARSGERKFQIRTGSDEADVREFHRLMTDLAERKAISVKPISYFASLLAEYGPRREGVLLLAEVDGEVIAGIMALAHGDRGYFWGSAASADHYRTHVNEFMHWKAMEWCKQRGCTRYDMMGVVESRTIDPDGNTVYLPFDQNAMKPADKGLFHFKKSFGGAPVRFVGAFDYTYNRPLYLLWRRMAMLQARRYDLASSARTRVEEIRTRISGWARPRPDRAEDGDTRPTST